MALYAEDVEEYYEFFEEEPYEAIRAHLAPEYAYLDAEGIEQLIEQTLGVPAEDMESSLGDLGRTQGRVGGAVAPALLAGGTGAGTLPGGTGWASFGRTLC